MSGYFLRSAGRWYLFCCWVSPETAPDTLYSTMVQAPGSDEYDTHSTLKETVTMPHSHVLEGRARAAAAMAVLVLCGLLFGGCASTTLQAQWTDPQFAGQSLRGATVLVVCDASDAVIERLCQDQLATQVAAAAATPATAPDTNHPTAVGGHLPENVFAAARRAGAKAILVSTIVPDATVVQPSPTIGFGLGGFRSTGGWHRSSGIGTGVGVAVPVGADRVQTAYAATMTLTDVDTRRLMWTSRVTTPASPDVNTQVSKLAKAGVEAAQQAGLL
jgi:hypothetical protein